MLFNTYFICFRALIHFTKDKQIPQYRGYILAVLMFVNALVQSLILHQYFHRCFLVGMRVRTAIIAAVYKKVQLGAIYSSAV